MRDHGTSPAQVLDAGECCHARLLCALLAQRTSLLIASLEADKRFGFPLAGQKVTPRMLVKAISLMVTVFIFLTPLIQEEEAGSGLE